MTANVPRDTTASAARYSDGLLRVAVEVNPCVYAQVDGDSRDLGECFTNGKCQLPEDEENARRIVACWNACHGITTETLETIGPRAVTALVDLLRQAVAEKPMRAATYHAIKAALKPWGGRT